MVKRIFLEDHFYRFCHENLHLTWSLGADVVLSKFSVFIFAVHHNENIRIIPYVLLEYDNFIILYIFGIVWT